MKEPLDLAPWFHCPKCGATLWMKDDSGFALYFEEQGGECFKCSTKVDFWTVMLDAVRNNFMMTGAYVVIGAKTTLFSFKLRNSENKELVFKDLGIPEDATILKINYTPTGDGLGCFPVELHGNTPHRGLPRQRVTVFGRSFPNTDHEEALINCAVTWIRPPDADDGWLHLLDAYQAYADGRWKATIIPANIAAESAITKAVFDGISTTKVTSKENLEEFLTKAATYSHQLNIVLPLLTRLFEVPPLGDSIRGLLNRLRGLRNKLAHTGALPKPFEQNEAAELLVASTFGFHYGRFFRARLAGNKGR